LPDRRFGSNTRYAMTDIGLAAFSVFFMQSPSFLAHQRALTEARGRSNTETLFGMAAIPTDNHIRQMLDGAPTDHFDGVFGRIVRDLDEGGGLAPMRRLGGRVLIALDGSEHFTSRKIHCPHCSTRKRSDGGTEYFHSFVGATLVAPGHATVLPLPPEFVRPQDGAEKQDCEPVAARRWLERVGAGYAWARPVYLGDDLYARQPMCEAVLAAGGGFIFVCKPSSHKTLSEYLEGGRDRRLQRDGGQGVGQAHSPLRQGNPGRPAGRPQPAGLRHAQRLRPGRRRLAGRQTETRRPNPPLRAYPHHHRLSRLPLMGQSLPVHPNRSPTATDRLIDGNKPLLSPQHQKPPLNAIMRTAGAESLHWRNGIRYGSSTNQVDLRRFPMGAAIR